MPPPPQRSDRPSRHGRVLRVGRAAALSGAARPAGRDRRRPAPPADEAIDPATGRVVRTFATLRGYVGRGVATTATYEARALGVHSALGLMKAAQLAPDAILLPTDFDAYRKYSRLFKAAVRGDRAADPGQRHRRDLHRPHRRAAAGRTDARRPGRAGSGQARGCRASPTTIRGGASATSPRRSRRPCAPRPASPARSASRRTSCWRRSPPSSTSRTGSRSCGPATSRRASGRCRRARSTASARSRARSSRRSASARSASSPPPTCNG